MPDAMVTAVQHDGRRDEVAIEEPLEIRVDGEALAVTMRTPGHTPGHVSYRDSRDGCLIAGDVVKTIGGLAVSSHLDLPFPFPYLGTWNPGRDVESAEALLELDLSWLAPGHGRAVPNPRVDLRRAVDRARRKLS